jgi:hypothetical protein
MSTITIAGYEVYPSVISNPSSLYGGQVRRSLDGTAWRKIVTKKNKVALVWDFIDAEEKFWLDLILSQCLNSSVSIVCDSPSISGTFILANDDIDFKDVEGSDKYTSLELLFEEV